MACEVFGQGNISYAKILTRKEVVPKEEHGLDTATDEGKKNRIQRSCYRRGLFALILFSLTLIEVSLACSLTPDAYMITQRLGKIYCYVFTLSVGFVKHASNQFITAYQSRSNKENFQHVQPIYLIKHPLHESKVVCGGLCF